MASLALGLLTLETLNAFSIDGKDFKNEKDSVHIVKMIEPIENDTIITALHIGRNTIHKNDSVVLRGTVRDSATNEPLIGVNVLFLPNTKIETITDFDGNFELDVKNDLPIELVFNYLGFNEIKKIILNSNEKINIELSQSPQFLQGEIVFSSAIRKQSKKETRKYKRKHKQ